MTQRKIHLFPAEGGAIETHAPAAAFTHPLSRPFLARHPWVGWLIFLLSMAVFSWVTWLVVTKSPPVAWDPTISLAIHRWAEKQPTTLVLFMRFWSAYGRDGVTLIALVLTVGWVWRKARRELWMLIFGVLGGELWFQVLGHLINRARPDFKDPFETLIGPGYPSGHAVTNVILGWMVLYLLLPHIRSRFRRALLILAVVMVVLLILFSRLFLGLHYPTDLIGGVAFGFAWGALVFTITDLHFFGKRPKS